MFIDKTEIVVRAGAGGNGCSAMFQIPYSRHPRPSGGDGGDGGDVIFVADPQLATLLDFQYRHTFKAERGGHGGNHNKTGKRGDDALVRVPVGTLVYDRATGDLLRDLTRPQQLTVARGGKGGIGNQNARRPTPGRPGQERRLRLELKLIADVGLVGLPNAGKSSLLGRISTARPKVAAYPFTTRYPVLGVVSVAGSRDRVFVACDIPGLIEGAHLGKGLGIEFLRHVERTRVLVHVVDLSGQDGRDPIDSYRQVNEELRAYNAALAQRPQLIAANKLDLAEARQRLAEFRASVTDPVHPISCATGEGIDQLLEAVWAKLREIPAPASEAV